MDDLDLRDLLACHALAGLFSYYATADGGIDNATVVRRAYELADLMLEERDR
jgi:hypothetical protein